MVHAVLFDLDGVLVDACEGHYQALNTALMEVGANAIERGDHEEVYNGLPTRDKLRMMVKRGLVKEQDIERIFKLKQDYTLEYIAKSIKPDKSKIEMVNKLKEMGVKIGCVTNCVQLTAELMLRQAGLLHLMDVLVTNEIGSAKPSPVGYQFAMRYLRALPEFTMIVEDSDVGFQAALASGAYKTIRVIDPKEVNWDRIKLDLN